MKRSFILLIFSAVFFSCGNDDEPQPAQSNLSATVDGKSFSTSNITMSQNVFGLYLKGKNGEETIRFRMPPAPSTGNHTLRWDNSYRAEYHNDSIFYADGGTMEISKLEFNNDSTIKTLEAIFNFEASTSSGSDSVSVANGKVNFYTF